MKKFYSLKVLDIEPLTSESVKIVFDSSKLDIFNFKAGQYITLRKEINKEDVRRSYSLSSAPVSGIEIGVKRIKDGLMSTFLTKELKVGSFIEVMPPTGNFYLDEKDDGRHYVAICAGSGITPILSMIKQVLNNNDNTYFTLIYGNQTSNSTMFLNELQSLENDFQSQFFIHYIFSREDVPECLKGRIDNIILDNIFNSNKDLKEADSYFLCGPGEMIDNVNQFLKESGAETNKIHYERFTSSLPSKKARRKAIDNTEIVSNVMVSVDGDDFEFKLSSKAETILDAAMKVGADLPFSCKGGVCCVCKAKVMEGKVTMDQNYSLSEEEVSQGYILACQSHPASENIVIDFDEM
jgi:ring-1,2-phenylacetyl-CoA epoxidase subunit PaaE